MNVCLVNPSLVTRRGLYYVPLGLSYLSAVLKNEHNISVVDAQFHSEEEIIKTAAENEVIGITSMSCNFPGAMDLACKIKEINSNALIVMGGTHVTFVDVEVLQQNPCIDVVVRNEGEYTILEFLRSLNRGDTSNVKGITYRKKNSLKRNPDRPFIQNLDSLPFPARDLWEAHKYYQEGSLPQIISARGCPHRCIFCSTSSMWGHQTRFRSPENVVDEIAHIVEKYNIHEVSFADDTFTIARSHTTEICKEILRRGLDITWGCNIRVDTINEDLLRLMKKAGLSNFFLGVESGNQKTLDFMNKKTNISQIRKTVALAKKYSIKVALSCILGFPNEKYIDVQKTIDFMTSLEGDSYLFNFLLVFPGTELYERRKELKITPIVDNPWERIEKTPFAVPTVETENLNLEELCQLYLEARSKLMKLNKR